MNERVCALIVAAGSGSRMGRDKIMMELGGKPVLRRCLENFETSPCVHDIVLVVKEPAAVQPILAQWNITKLHAVVAGGDTRTQSVCNGLAALPQSSTVVAIQDGARCFTTHDIIERTVAAAVANGTGVAGMPCKDTIKRVDEQGIVVETPDRAALRQIQTPQTFRFSLINKAYSQAQERGITATDDAALLEQLGYPVHIVDGSYENIKLTSPEDIAAGEAILRSRETGGRPMIAVGLGYDVHRLVPERKLILGGVEIPHTLGLLGHSDADVLTHAVMDALLGAAALGDIGKLFPDTDDAYKGIDSQILLRHVARVLQENGWRVGNIDATIAAQKPKLAPHIEAMRRTMAANLGIDMQRVSVKATTTEHLGFEGEELGISVQAVALLER